MIRSVSLQLLLAVAFAASALAWPSDEGVPEGSGAALAAPLADEAVEGSGTPAEAAPANVSVTVRVQRGDGEGNDEPVADVRVRGHIIAPPHDVIRTVDATTDAAGNATFDLEVAPGREFVADVEAGRRYFSDPIDISDGGDQSIVVDVLGQTSDPSLVKAESVHTIVELWEGYVTVTQAWNLTVKEPLVFASERGPDGRPNLATLLRIPLPETAEGVNIIRPEGEARYSGTTLSTTMEIAPRSADDRHRPADVVVQYSIPTEDRPDVAWDQLIGMDVDSFSVVIPQESTLARHPRLDVDVVTGDCADPSQVCLTPADDGREHVPLRQDVDIRMVRGAAAAGQTVHIATSGWPAPSRWERRVAPITAGLASIFALVLFMRERRSRPSDPTKLRIAALQSQRASLLDAAADVGRRLDDGLILERDHDLAMERIRQQLGVVYRRLRELDAGEESDAAE